MVELLLLLLVIRELEENRRCWMDDCFEMRGSFEEEFDLVFEEEGLKESALIIIRYAANGRIPKEEETKGREKKLEMRFTAISTKCS